ncbi:MAG: D-alanyl-D-alanine carboxypeptidase [Rickettsiales bacterium]|nr:D-alanyl-D-alanine carboxypeptidase [Rickettsiales bacterium]
MKFLLAFLLLSFSAQAGFETPAKQAMLYDATTSTILFSKDADKRMGPSSMSKMMTVYIVLEKLKSGELKLTDTFHVSEKSWKKGGSKMFVKLGEKITVQDLLRGIIIQSGNDACIVVAEGIAGTEKAFAEIMNVKARQLGLTGSHFANATGWPDPQHYMTSRDLVKLAEALIRDFPNSYHYWGEKEFTYSDITQPNRNALLGELGVDGIKTGHTDAAGYGIATSGEMAGRRLISVVNGLDSKKGRISASRELLTYGFKQFEAVQLFAKGKALEEAKIWYGSQETVGLKVEKPLLITLPKYDKSDVKMSANFVEPVIAPVQKGQKLGVLKFEAKGMEPINLPLVATESVAKQSLLERLLPTLRYRLFGEK